MTVNQGENQRLKDYIKRFNTESELIPDLNDNVAFTALLFGIKSIKLKFELVHDKVSTFSEAIERAERIIEESEVCKVLVANNKGKRKQEDNYHENKNRRSRRAKSDNEGLKYNVDRECGHTTRNCRELKRALDNLAEEGKLNQYLKYPPKDKQRSKGSKVVQEAHSSANTNMSINVIAGGFAF
uniref:Uncharacterized protein n=1 Tax=Chenopodium quinoa TaxID=63459 RepID=A0A803N8H3_CHEQI